LKVSLLTEVSTPPQSLQSFEGLAKKKDLADALALAATLEAKLEGKVVWNVSSTAAGGGVAEMLHGLIGYARGMGFDARWLVLSGDPEFFRITKRLHNAFHGERGDGSPLDDDARKAYEATLRANGAELRSHVTRGDIVFLHDPQTAGLAPELANRAAAVVWRCHIGNGERGNADEAAAWAFLEPYLRQLSAAVFTRDQYVPPFLREKAVIIPPHIDPLSAKNQPMTPATARAVLAHIGVMADAGGRGKRVFTRSDGTPTRVERLADVVRLGAPPPPSAPLVVQVSRWDRLKDPLGVMRGFAVFLADPLAAGVHLALVGPQSAGVTDDPEGAEVYREVVSAWERLPEETRRRVHLVSLPMDDLEENAAMVNAIQRHATVVIQKSLREGFGLTVTEAMWKARPVIGSAVGGIQDQITHLDTGLLVDPTSDEDLAKALVWVFSDLGRAAKVGRRGKARVRHEYLGVGSLLRWGRLLIRLARERSEAPTDKSV
jgi:trehalose synthase